MPDLTDKLTDNPLMDAAQKKIGPLPAWQWGAVIGVGVIALRLVLPPSGTGSFFRRADKSATSDVATAGFGGTDRRPVAPSAGLPPGPPLSPGFTTGDQITPGGNPFLSVTTPGGINIAGEGLSPGDIVSILTAILPPPSATTRVPRPIPSPRERIPIPSPRGETRSPAPKAPVAPRSPQIATPQAPAARRAPAPVPLSAPRQAPPKAPAPRRTTNAPVAPRKITPQYGRTRPKRTRRRSGSGGSRNKML